MAQQDSLSPRRSAIVLLAVMSVIAVGLLFTGEARRAEFTAASQTAALRPTEYLPLTSVHLLPETDGEMCEWEPASGSTVRVAALRQELLQSRAASLSSPAPAADEKSSVDLDRAPARTIRDTYPTYSAVAVDTNTNEVFLQDENLFGYKVFNRLDNTPSGAAMTEPKRVVGGFKTKMDFNCDLYIDPKTGDVYSVNNDIVNTLVVFPHDARGDVAPKRELTTPHRTFGIAVDEAKQEMFLSVQHPPAVFVYHKTAQGNDPPVRILEGRRTLLQDPHGIALDTKDRLVFVSNYGNVSYSQEGNGAGAGGKANGGAITSERLKKWGTTGDRRAMIPGSGEFASPSITVYPLGASEDTPPVRVIQGPNTQLNWPAQIYFDEEHGELYVANDMGDSILVFGATDNGNVAPARVIKGSKTGIKNPTGVFVDSKSQELWVANMGNHGATVYSRAATGNAAPLRTIRSAPSGSKALAIGNPGAVGYDSKREEVLVPN